MSFFFRLAVAIALSFVTWSCSPSTTSDDYLSPPTDLEGKLLATEKARQALLSETYKSVGKPFGCDTDCADEEIGFSEARSSNITKSKDCTNEFSEKSLMTNATQDGCRAYVQAFTALLEEQG